MSKTIMIVEDHTAVRTSLVAWVQTEFSHTEIVSVSSGEEAVAYAKQHSVDLLLLDMLMDPGIDGFNTYQKILKMHPGQKAIITSGYSKTDRIQQTLELGLCEFVRKPYSLETIATTARRLLDQAPVNP